MSSISIIVASDQNMGIGKNNQLPWHLPADLKYFKSVTSGHTVIMGRKTFDSMGKALPNRRNIVISRQTNLLYPDAEVVNSLDDALELTKDDGNVFIIGGAEIFKQSMEIATVLYHTEIHHEFDTDTFLAPINRDLWKEVKREDKQPDDKNLFPYSFVVYEKYG